MKKIMLFIGLLLLLIGSIWYVRNYSKKHTFTLKQPVQSASTQNPTETPKNNPLSIHSMQQKAYPGSDLIIEETISTTASYTSYLVSYTSENLKQYGLLTVPKGPKPKGGWPVILFNHGYIPPAQYNTQTSYASMITPLASAGYIVFKPDYRGNGSSDGTPLQPYISPDYITDSMNALASIKRYADANPQKIGVFGHSMGGNISLHELEITQAFKAAVIMAGTVGDQTSILKWWQQRITDHSIVGNDLDTSSVVMQMVREHGDPASNASYWDQIDQTKYLQAISAPVQLHVGTADVMVPVTFSSQLNELLQKQGKTVEYHSYQGADHNLAPYTATAMRSAVTFFDKYLK